MGVKANLSIWGLYQYDNTIFSELEIPESVTETTLIDNILLNCSELELVWTDPNFLKMAIGAWSRKQLPIWEEIERILAIRYEPQYNFDKYEETDDETKKTGTDTMARTGTDTVALTGTDTLSKTGTIGTVSESTSVKDQDISEQTNTETDETENVDKDEDQDITNKVNGFNSALGEANLAIHDHQDLTKNTDQDTTRHGEAEENRTKTDDTTVTDNSEATVTNNLTEMDTKNLQNQETKNLQDQQTKNLKDEFTHRMHAYGNIGTISSQKLLMDELELRKLNIYDVITEDFKNQFCLRVYY